MKNRNREPGFIQKINPGAIATELFSASVCNLRCSYCYIPKNDEMKNYHKEILKSLEDDTFIDNLEAVHGSELQYLALWGTEQTLIFNRLKNNIGRYLEKFPKIKVISFSSNFCSNWKSVIEMMEAIEKNTKNKITFRFQISIDGPEWINDIGRGIGVTERIYNNIKKFFDALQDYTFEKVTLNFEFKPTVSIDFFEKMNNSEDLLIEWYTYFYNYRNLIMKHQENLESNIKVTGNNIALPSLVVPGKYTSEDGKILQLFNRKIRKLKSRIENNLCEELKDFPVYSMNLYTVRFRNMMNDLNVNIKRPTSGTCSGGDTQIGVSKEGNMFPCHRMFLYDNQNYIDGILKQKEYTEDWNVAKTEVSILDNVKKHLITNIHTSSDKKILNQLYIQRGYHDYLNFRVSSTISMIHELVYVGQANRIYLDNEEMAKLLALYLNTQLSCNAENYLNTGSYNLTPVSLVRFFANGAFEEIVEEYVGIIGDKDGK